MRYGAGVLGGLALGFAIWCALISAQLGAPTASSRWDAEALQWKAQLAARRDGPRLLVIGGSGPRYGINCAIVEARVGMPCANLAYHAGLRLRYTLDYAKRVARPGDVLLLAFEYQVYDEAGTLDPIFVDYVMARDPAYLRTMSVPALAQFVISVDGDRLFQGLVTRAAPLDRDRTDTTNPFDRNGDELHNQAGLRTAAMTATVNRAAPVYALLDGKAPDRYSTEILTALAAWCRAHGVTLWATFPATVRYAVYDSTRVRATLARIGALFASLGVPVLERPDDLFWPKDSFFDTAYHPTAEAAAVRSRALAERICAQLTSRCTALAAR